MRKEKVIIIDLLWIYQRFFNLFKFKYGRLDFDFVVFVYFGIFFYL